MTDPTTDPTTDPLARLAAIMRTEESRRFIVAWPDAEAAIGRPLPDDYKNLIEHFGPGSYDGFLTADVPGIASRAYELIQQLDSLARTLEDHPDAAAFFAPYPIHPAPGGLLKWGSTTAGDFVFWEPCDSDPNRWPVLAWDVEDTDWYRFDGGCVEFLVAFFDGSLPWPMVLPREDEQAMRFAPDDGAWHGSGSGLTPTSYFASGQR